MNEIRKNTEEEIIIAKAHFKAPILEIVLRLVLFISCLLMFSYFYSIYNYTAIGVLFCLLMLFFGFSFIPYFFIKNSSCTVTNKRIYGKKFSFSGLKEYSYRLDKIDNIETVGKDTIIIHFEQGNKTDNSTTSTDALLFKIEYIANLNEFYNQILKLITNIKNDKDLIVDIEMSKVDAEKQKAAAFEKLANNISNNQYTTENTKSDYISELKELKGLVDAGIITEEEFQEKKKQLLK